MNKSIKEQTHSLNTDKTMQVKMCVSVTITTAVENRTIDMRKNNERKNTYETGQTAYRHLSIEILYSQHNTWLPSFLIINTSFFFLSFSSDILLDIVCPVRNDVLPKKKTAKQSGALVQLQRLEFRNILFKHIIIFQTLIKSIRLHY